MGCGRDVNESIRVDVLIQGFPFEGIDGLPFLRDDHIQWNLTYFSLTCIICAPTKHLSSMPLCAGSLVPIVTFSYITNF
jgi:hypothetical protein